MNMTLHEFLFFGGFVLGIGALLALDLGVFNRKSHEVKYREALMWTVCWVSLSILFFFFLRFHGHTIHDLQNNGEIIQKVEKYKHPLKIANDMPFEEALSLYDKNLSLEYLTGYLIEYSLSVDNIFVIIMIFLSFGIHRKYYHRVLFWGILGAVIMRFLFIFLASALIQQFEWILYLFGGLLVYIGSHMAYEFYKEGIIHRRVEKTDPQDHFVVRWLSKVFLVTKEDKGEKFWVKEGGKVFITPLFIVLVLVEFSDVVFAVDSVPAVFSVTRDPFIVFFSNIFAILGLRSLFFLVINVMHLRFLKAALAVLLVFVGLKMLSAMFVEHLFTTNVSLLIIVGILASGVIASLLWPGKKYPPEVNII